MVLLDCSFKRTVEFSLPGIDKNIVTSKEGLNKLAQYLNLHALKYNLKPILFYVLPKIRLPSLINLSAGCAIIALWKKKCPKI